MNLEFWVTNEIVSLRRTPAETLLLARICYRAAISPDGKCRDTNKELGAAVNIHPQSVSDLINKFDKAQIVANRVDQDGGNKRQLIPISKILTPYKEKADRYKQKHDQPYKSIPYSPPKDSADTSTEITDSLSAENSEGLSETLRGSKSNAQSHYKEYKTYKTLKNSLLKKVKELLLVRKKRKAKKSPPVPAAPPVPSIARIDPFKLKSSSESCNVPFSTWYTTYKFIGNEAVCRRIWATLTDEERTTALAHTLEYVEKTPNKQFRKTPTNYLDLKYFNEEIIDRRENNTKSSNSDSPRKTGQREIIDTKYTHQKFGPPRSTSGSTNQGGTGRANAA